MSAPWTAAVLTIYPEMFPGPLACAPVGRALENGLWRLETVDIRGFARDKHASVDDTPAGGGPGMVMRADVLARAVDATHRADRALIYFTPRGERLTQGLVRDLTNGPGVTLLCGRFEGVDERLLEARPFREVSLGDFVMSGGEFAAFALIDAAVRLIPGVVGEVASTEDESFETGLLEYPHYTRPQVFEGREIPAVLTSGHHANIEKWRRAEAEKITKARRPDLWAAYEKAASRRGDRKETDKTR